MRGLEFRLLVRERSVSVGEVSDTNMRRPSIIWLGLFMLVPITLGGLAMHASGVGTARIAQNFIAWAIGAAAAFAIGRFRFAERTNIIILCVLLVTIAATLLEAGQEDVHRWIRLGPLYVNAAATVLPSIIVLLCRTRTNWAAGSAIFVFVLLFIQPDRSQMIGFAAAMVALAYHRHRRFMGISAAFAATATLLTAMRPDPLQGVPEVEGIIGLGFATAPVLGIAMLISLVLLCVLPAALAVRTSFATAGIALSVYLQGITLATAIGEFPVPFVGLGMSFPIGLWLAIGLLRQEERGVSAQNQAE